MTTEGMTIEQFVTASTAERRQEALRRAKLTQADVAAELDLSRQALSQWANGKGDLSAENTRRIYVLVRPHFPELELADLNDAVPTLGDVRNGATLGERLVSLMTIAELSRRDVARALGVSGPTVSHWRTGYRTPNDNVQAKLCALFAATVPGFVDAMLVGKGGE